MWRDVWYDVRYRVRTFMHRDAAECDLDAEIEDHLAREAEALERSGLSPADARRQARLAFGGLEGTRERTRDAWGTSVLDCRRAGRCGMPSAGSPPGRRSALASRSRSRLASAPTRRCSASSIACCSGRRRT